MTSLLLLISLLGHQDFTVRNEAETRLKSHPEAYVFLECVKNNEDFEIRLRAERILLSFKDTKQVRHERNRKLIEQELGKLDGPIWIDSVCSDATCDYYRQQAMTLNPNASNINSLDESYAGSENDQYKVDQIASKLWLLDMMDYGCYNPQEVKKVINVMRERSKFWAKEHFWPN